MRRGPLQRRMTRSFSSLYERWVLEVDLSKGASIWTLLTFVVLPSLKRDQKKADDTGVVYILSP